MLSDLRHRLRALFHRDAVEHELDAELRFHLEHEIEKRVAAGIPHDEAVREARLALVGFRDRTTTLSGLAAHYPTAPLFVGANGQVGEINGAVVSANFFSLLGLTPALGRFFHDDEDRVPDRDRVAVLGHNFWRTRFAASPTAIGSSVRINGSDFTIVGVAPSSFVGITTSPIELYI